MNNFRRKAAFPLIALLTLAARTHTGIALQQTPPRAATEAPRTQGQPRLVVQLGHSGAILSVAFSPDGRFAVSGGSEGVAILWEVETGREVRRFVGHEESVGAVTFSPDGRFVLTGSGGGAFAGGEAVGDRTTDNSARLWDAATGRELQRFKGHTGPVRSVEFSPDGSLALTGSLDGTARLWDVRTGKLVRQFDPKAGTINAARFSPDGRFVATGGGDEIFAEPGPAEPPDEEPPINEQTVFHIYLWDVQDGTQPLRRFEAHKDIFFGFLNFSPDGKRLISSGPNPFTAGSAMGPISVWDVATGKKLKDMEGYGGPAVYLPYNQQIVVGGEFGGYGTYLVDTNTGDNSPLKRSDEPADLDAATDDEESLASWTGLTESVAVSHDGRTAIVAENPISSGGSSGDMYGETSLCLYDLGTKMSVRCFEGRSKDASSVGLYGEGRTISSGDAVWDVGSGASLQLNQSDADAEETLVAVSRDGRLAFVNGKESARLLNLSEQREIAHLQLSREASFSNDGHFLLTCCGGDDEISDEENPPLESEQSESGEAPGLRLIETKTGKVLWTREFYPLGRPNAQSSWYGHTPSNTDAALTPDGRSVMVRTGEDGLLLLDSATGAVKRKYADEFTGGHALLAFSPDSRYFIKGGEGIEIDFVSVVGGSVFWSYGPFPQASFITYHLAISPNGHHVLASGTFITDDPAGYEYQLRLLDVRTKRDRVIKGQSSNGYAFSPDGNFMATVGRTGMTVSVWDLRTLAIVERYESAASPVASVAFFPEGRHLLTGQADGTARIWDRQTRKELCGLTSFTDGEWAVVGTDGRFDTSNVESVEGLHWVVPDEPFSPLSLEIFMRDYYEPRLLTRILAGEQLKPIRSLAGLNRVQPSVKVARVEPQAGAPDSVTVTVEVARAKSAIQRDKQGNLMETGVYDLRLFRDGQLVGYAPEDGGEIEVDPQTGKATISFTVKFPHGKDAKEVEFSAYAFNVDRVKSATDRRAFELPKDLAVRKGRAYLVTVGVNAYENPAWNLRYAVNDARAMRRVMSERLKQKVKNGEYAEVVEVLLLSVDEEKDGQKVSVRDATKRKVQAVFDLLAGKEVDEALKQTIPNAAQLREATPDDLIILSFSSHGYADSDGVFYILPSDIDAGGGKEVTQELLGRAISSNELSLWLRDVDAGELVMIVDACHAAAAVEGKEFKPGPMGSRGLGQLAYDKGMRILTATQAENVAIESGALGQGLLTYALVRNGLEEEAADFKARDGAIRLKEWLEFAEARVPQLYELVRTGKMKAVGNRDPLGEGKKPVGAAKQRGYQTPSLFDFSRSRRDLVLVGATRK